MRRLRVGLGVSCGALLSACGPALPASIELAQRSHLGIGLHVGESAASLSLRSGQCEPFTGEARMNGQPLVQVQTGHLLPAVPFTNDTPVCDPPAWEVPLPLPQEAATTFEVLDETGRLVLTARELTAPRTLTLAPGQGATVRWGEPLVLAWSPATDFFSVSPRVQLRQEGRADIQVHWMSQGPGGLLTFELPAAPEEGWAQGPVELRFRASVVRIGVERCEPDPDECIAYLVKEQADPRDGIGVGNVAEFTLPLSLE